MNILILTNHLNIGGITRYVLNLSLGLKKIGHRVFVGSLPGWGRKFLEENKIPFLKLPLKTKSIFSPRLFFSYFILKTFIQRENIELIHAQTRITQFLASHLSSRLNIAYVCTFHGFYRPHLMRRMFPCLGDLTIAISQAVGQHLIEDFNLNKKNLQVIYNSVNPTFSCSINKPRTFPSGRVPQENRKAQDVDYAHLKGSPTLGIIARLSEEKGHLVLFSAFRQLIKNYPAARLLIVGSGKKGEKLKDWVKREKLNNQITFLGNIAELSSLFKILDVSVLPSTLEGLGLSILEAQANGVPVIASSIGGIPEIITDKETGILVKPSNPDELYQGIKLLLQDSQLRQKIINNAKRQIEERFSLEKMLSGVQQVYTQAIRQRKAG